MKIKILGFVILVIINGLLGGLFGNDPLLFFLVCVWSILSGIGYGIYFALTEME
jgi:hypothetical protein